MGFVTRDEIISRLRAVKRKEVSRATAIPYGYLNKLVYGEIKNPGSAQIDRLRGYFMSQDLMNQGRQ